MDRRTQKTTHGESPSFKKHVSRCINKRQRKIRVEKAETIVDNQYRERAKRERCAHTHTLQQGPTRDQTILIASQSLCYWRSFLKGTIDVTRESLDASRASALKGKHGRRICCTSIDLGSAANDIVWLNLNLMYIYRYIYIYM